MSQSERLYRLTHLLSRPRGASKAQLLQALGVSTATLKRDLAHLRDRMNAPVVFDLALRTYRYDANKALPGIQYELPGLWFSAEEVHALLTMQHLLANLDTGGLLGPVLIGGRGLKQHGQLAGQHSDWQCGGECVVRSGRQRCPQRCSGDRHPARWPG